MRTLRRALLTGGTGYVGGRLARRLAADGWEVHLAARPSSDLSRLGDIVPSPVVHLLDGTTEGACRLVAEAAPDVVFHLASLFLARHEPSQVEPLIRANVLFGAQLLEGMARAGARRLVVAGTAWQNFEGGGYRPVNLYAATKEAFEALLAYYVDALGFASATLKIFDTYGPGDPRPKLVPTLLEAVRKGKPLSMSPGGQEIDLVHADDAARAFAIAGEGLLDGSLGAGHRTYALSSGDPLPLRVLVERILAALGASLEIDWGGRAYREREVMTTWKGGERLPGWKPSISLEEGIRAIVRTEGTP